MGNDKRVQAGVRAGGRYDNHNRDEASVSLGEPPIFNEINRVLRGQKFFVAAMKKWPAIYSTESTPVEDKIIVGHFFGGSADWYITEYNPQTGEAFGYTDLGHGGEWGYTDLREVEAHNNRSSNGLPLIFERDSSFHRDVAWHVIPELKAAHAADTISLGTDCARADTNDRSINAEVGLRHGEHELRDTTALAIARSFGAQYTELYALGHSGHGSRKRAYTDLQKVNESRSSQSPEYRARVDAMFTWILNGGDNY